MALYEDDIQAEMLADLAAVIGDQAALIARLMHERDEARTLVCQIAQLPRWEDVQASKDRIFGRA